MNIEDVIAAWNRNADEYNQWDSLDADERVNFALQQSSKEVNTTTSQINNPNTVAEMIEALKHADQDSLILGANGKPVVAYLNLPSLTVCTIEEQMTHIDDWLDDTATGPADVKEWLEHFRRPAADKDYKWLAEHQLFCTYKDGKRYRCTGCSRMGDVWLTKHFEHENGYDLRIDIADCTDWEVVANAIIIT